MNDFEKFLEISEPNMYTDDPSISYASIDMNKLFNDINDELDLVSSWIRQSKLSLYNEKSEFTLIGHPKQLNRAKDFPDFEVEDQKLCRVQNKVSRFHNRRKHELGRTTQNSNAKGKKSLGAMFNLKNVLSQKQLATIYRALIKRHLRYCNVIWGNLSNSNWNPFRGCKTEHAD